MEGYPIHSLGCYRKPDKQQDHIQSQCLPEKLAAFLLCLLALLICYRGFDPLRTDFRSFYVAAQIVRQGAGHYLYDVNVQHDFQLHYAGRIGLIFNYPAATALLYLPGAWLTLRAAYVLWTAVSLAMLLGSAALLNATLGFFRHPVMLLAATLLYVPVWLNLMHGSTALCMLIIDALALQFFMQNREFAAGCALGAGLLKFHLVLPFLFVLLLRRQWRAVAGFTAIACIFLGLCIWVAGWRFVLEYPRFLLRLPSLPLAAMNVSGMATLRGLYVGLARREPPLVLMAAVAAGLLIWSARTWRKAPASGFAITIAVTALISYHFNPQDLSLLIIPMAIVLKAADWRWSAITIAAFAPPLPLLLLGPRFWLMGCLVLVLLMALVATTVRATGFAHLEGRDSGDVSSG
jgi:Glycosyltransferase family 87